MAITTEFIDYEQDGELFQGYLALPEDKPKAVIALVHAWGGLSAYEQEKTEALANWGYAGFAVDVYGKGKRGASPEENEALMGPLVGNRTLLQSRLERGLTVAKQNTGLSKAAAIGFCFGGLAVLDMARTNMAVEGVASFHGLLGAPGNTADTIKPKVLALHGWDDPMATPEDVTAFGKEMNGAKADWQLHAYGGVLHAFTNKEANAPDQGAQYSADADRRSMLACRNFLGELFD